MIKLTGKDLTSFSSDLIVYLVEQDAEPESFVAAKPIRSALKAAYELGDFQGKEDEEFLLYPSLLCPSLPTSQESGHKAKKGKKGAGHDFLAKRLLFVGLGKPDDDIDIRREQLRLAGGLVAKQGGQHKAKEVVVVLPQNYLLSASDIAEAVTEGLLLGNYRFDTYKTKTAKDDTPPQAVSSFLLHDGGLSPSAVRRGMNRGKILAGATTAARDMANEPGNAWTSAEFAHFAKKISKKNELRCKVLEKAVIKKLGMGGIIGVNQGSAVPPRLVIVEYRTNKNNPTIMLVGKGLTFDSGGISIKPASGMEDMKYDMCGGAAVLAAMQAIGEIKPDGVNVVGLVPSTDNMSGSKALKPGDIIRHYGGKNAEIINTDAEGRLILADALAYGVEIFSPAAVVDVATLTGAAIVGLGHHNTAMLSNNDALAQQLVQAGKKAGEPMWRLPLGKEYSKQIQSKIADIKNTGGPGGGTITAACYLQEFIGETPWAHLDIAGTAWDFTKKSYVPEGPSGTAARTLVRFVKNWTALPEDDKEAERSA